MSASRLAATHALLPALAFVALVALTDLDQNVARAWAYDSTLGGFPARNAWWASELVHRWGRYLIWAIGIGSIGTSIAGFRVDGWRKYRRPALFAFLAIALATLTVGILKGLTNIDCPWDLAGFGGTRPYVHIFADRPDDLPRAACFPAAHSSSGFALMAFYFVLRERRPHAAWAALGLGILVGAIFSFGQEARGAHFLSHDLCSAFIVWFIELALYTGAFRARLWPVGPA